MIKRTNSSVDAIMVNVYASIIRLRMKTELSGKVAPHFCGRAPVLSVAIVYPGMM